MDVQTIPVGAAPASTSDFAASASRPEAGVSNVFFSQATDPADASASSAPGDATPSSTPNAASLVRSAVRNHATALSAVTKASLGATVSVSYDTISERDRVIMVFKDASTGKTIFTVPSEILIQLGHFFDEVSGTVVDSKA